MKADSMIFDVIPDDSGLAFGVCADPEKPYLAHHDVGVPLLGTVMSLEAMAECSAILYGKKPNRISNVVAGEDCLIPAPRELSVVLQRQADHVHARLSDGEIPVFSCDISFDKQETPAQATCPAGCGSATAETIYRCFFHGPAFQVVEKAVLFGDTMITHFHEAVPPLADASRSEALPVRAMEFCLQSAGLLDIALRQYLSVPLSIGQVLLYETEDLSGLWAQAQISGPGSDVHAWNGKGQPVLSVLDYRTKPMPYASQELDAVYQGFHNLSSHVSTAK